ncbi:FAD-dependent monooxygenase [Cupriavidus agavae]|uniref:2-polyprenyl-6-methoxyphenol hydroxylase-like FAD-dependent oxidoreductase n=1 Tax=Cupriavidus agavae TaxID=1001822 RepID=A0A4Q7RZC2_9BURK|nr:FAD-dependent monooxygenase [Cupriavidus agavae]RZT39203.1 2-polyprenyl-6-methoxyphenol hydroxylase-like FAD-dependent oxidoreductase [Cupriavidus agavae]
MNTSVANTVETDVVIVGGGPAGLMLAIELGCRDVRCLVLEEDVDPPDFPKANATSARTMEHYRRRGFSADVRALGLPPDYPQDLVYCTRLAHAELSRFRVPSRAQAASREAFGDYGAAAWPTPELPHRAQQMFIEPILRREAAKYPSVDLRFGARAVRVADHGDGVEVDAVQPDGGAPWRVAASYVVGCDGPRSMVRKTLGIQYAGQGGEKRDFFGGQMLSIYFRSSDLYDVLGKERAWQYWAVNASQRGLLIAIDGVDTFLLAVQLKDGQQPGDIDARATALAVVGAPHDFRLIGRMPWVAGYTLVAERLAAGRGFLAGDAAHLFTPTGGMGYNTSIDDAVNLGWKLAAVLNDGAPPALLDSYDLERRPMAVRNTTFARRMADSIGNVPISASLEAQGAPGDAARAELGCALAAHVVTEINIPGLQLGVRYLDSPIVAREPGAAPPDDPNHYIAGGWPGSRAPHAMVDGVPLFDRFGRDFTLLSFDGADATAWQASARRLGIALDVLRVDDPEVRALYGAPAVLIRPDHHIAWRGEAGADAAAVLAVATGGARPD